jgi:hypothetical protein
MNHLISMELKNNNTLFNIIIVIENVYFSFYLEQFYLIFIIILFLLYKQGNTINNKILYIKYINII